MTARRNLTAVPGGKAPAKKTAAKRTAKKTVAKAAEGGDRRELLEAMRDRVAQAVENPKTPARDLAALTRRLLEITAEIESIKAAAEQEAREREASSDEAWDGSAI